MKTEIINEKKKNVVGCFCNQLRHAVLIRCPVGLSYWRFCWIFRHSSRNSVVICHWKLNILVWRCNACCPALWPQTWANSSPVWPYPVLPSLSGVTWTHLGLKYLLPVTGFTRFRYNVFFLISFDLFLLCISNLLLVGNYFRSAFTTWHWVSCDRSLNASPGTVSFPSAHGLLGASSDSRWRKSTPKRHLTGLMLLESSRSNRFSFHTSSNPSKGSSSLKALNAFFCSLLCKWHDCIDSRLT